MDQATRHRTLTMPETSAPRPGEELDAARLEAYLRPRLPECNGALVVEQFPHGHSNLTYLVRFGGSEYVLRRPPFGNTVKSAHDMGREYRVLSRLCAVYPAAPRPYLYCEDESVVGAPFYCMERRRGMIFRQAAGHDWLDPPTARVLCRALVDNLAELHALDYRAAGMSDVGKPEGYVARQVQGWIRRYHDAQTGDAPSIEAIAEWLVERLPPESGACVVHNDYKFDNVLFDSVSSRDASCDTSRAPRVTAVLDWEMSTIGDPLLDLGTTLGYWIDVDDGDELSLRAVGPTLVPGALTRREVVERYAERTGRPQLDMLYYYVFGLVKIAAIIQQIYSRYRRGATTDARFAQLDEQVRSILGQAGRAIDRGRV